MQNPSSLHRIVPVMIFVPEELRQQWIQAALDDGSDMNTVATNALRRWAQYTRAGEEIPPPPY